MLDVRNTQFLAIASDLQLLTSSQYEQLVGLTAAESLDVCAFRFNWTQDDLIRVCCSFEHVQRADMKGVFPDHRLLDAFEWEVLINARVVPLYHNPDLNILGVLTDNPFRHYASVFSDYSHEQLNVFYAVPAEMESVFFDRRGWNLPHSILLPLLKIGIEKGASDIHFFSTARGMTIKFRLEHGLVEHSQLTMREASRVIRELKFDANLDVSDKFRSQDGVLTLEVHGQNMTVRVASYPSVYGEDFVCRLFYRMNAIQSLDGLGFSTQSLAALRQMRALASGLVLVNGPTGAGKTSTIYGCLIDWQQEGRNCVTIEDPVELTIEGVRQAHVHERSGFGVSDALRAVMRQDPDVIVIGEIRDAEIAQLAIQAAYSGHLVIASFHAGSIEETVLRLASFQLDPYLLQMCLKWVFCQRLVAEVCRYCSADVSSNLGCVRCDWTGKVGRLPILEWGKMEESSVEDDAIDPYQRIVNRICRGQYAPIDNDRRLFVDQGRIDGLDF